MEISFRCLVALSCLYSHSIFLKANPSGLASTVNSNAFSVSLPFFGLHRELHVVPLPNPVLNLCLIPWEKVQLKDDLFFVTLGIRKRGNTSKKDWTVREEKRRKWHRNTTWVRNRSDSCRWKWKCCNRTFQKSFYFFYASFLFLHKLWDSVIQNWRTFLSFLASLLSYTF